MMISNEQSILTDLEIFKIKLMFNDDTNTILQIS